MIYLMFDGRCKEALDRYKKAFNIDIKEFFQYKDTNNPGVTVKDFDPEWVLRASFVLQGMPIMALDSPSRSSTGDNTLLHIFPKDVAEAKRMWEIMSVDAQKVFMKPQKTIAMDFHGSLKDKFGVNWMFTVQAVY